MLIYVRAPYTDTYLFTCIKIVIKYLSKIQAQQSTILQLYLTVIADSRELAELHITFIQQNNSNSNNSDMKIVNLQ